MNKVFSLPSLILISIALSTWTSGQPAPHQAAPDPSLPGPCPVESQHVTLDTGLEAAIYYPDPAGCGKWANAPYPGVVFAHGFSVLGISDGDAENAGNGEHMASWGFVVAVPRLPDDFETRVEYLLSVLDYLSAQAADPNSFLFRKVDPGRLATSGHSTGGSTALAAAARDPRIRGVVALDPVFHEGPYLKSQVLWDPQTEGAAIQAPVAVLGSPAHACNSQGDYTELYPWIGSSHKASYLVAEASHCDFLDPGNLLCSLICGATSSNRTLLSQRYMTAWFNYYLLYKAEYFDYLYGEQQSQDAKIGLITAQVDTAPKHFIASAFAGFVHLTWKAYSHPMISGYQIYRRLPEEIYSQIPFAQLGLASGYLDLQVQPEQNYFYNLRSEDSAGNLHQAATEVSILTPSQDDPIYLAILRK